MATLTDFEELLASIHNSLIKDYMREAMNCYHNGAYRGCIVMSYIALFDDLIEKLGSIKDVNSDAKTIYIEVEKRRKDQDVFENYLLNQLASKQLISDLDSTTIDLIRDRRNKAAHPSGHHPSAEEGRYIFFEVIDKFLSKEALGTKHIVDEIVSRFHNTKFFISTSISDTETTVRHEIDKVHPEAYPYLIIQVFKAYKENSDTIEHNASYFLDGLACIDNENINEQLAQRVLNPCLGDDKLAHKCLSIISSNPSLIEIIEEVPKGRFKALLSEKIEEMDTSSVSTKLVHPSVIIKRMLDKLGLEYIANQFNDDIKNLISKIPFREGLIDLVISQSDELTDYYYTILYKNAGSYTFDTANNFIDRFYDIEAAVVNLFSGERCLTLMVEIIDSASHGAWRPGEIVENKFVPFKILRKNVIEYLDSGEEEQALKIIKKRVSGSITIEEFKKRYLLTADQEQAA